MSSDEKISEKTMTRREFLKMTGLGGLGIVIASKFNIDAEAANVPVTDNLGGGDIVKSATPPRNTKVFWYNTGSRNGNVDTGVIAAYKGGTWTPITSTWQ